MTNLLFLGGLCLLAPRATRALDAVAPGGPNRARAHRQQQRRPAGVLEQSGRRLAGLGFPGRDEGPPAAPLAERKRSAIGESLTFSAMRS